MRFIILLGHITVIGFGQELGFLIFASVGKGSMSEVLIQEAGLYDTIKELDKYEWVSKKGRLLG